MCQGLPGAVGTVDQQCSRMFKGTPERWAFGVQFGEHYAARSYVEFPRMKTAGVDDQIEVPLNTQNISKPLRHVLQNTGLDIVQLVSLSVGLLYPLLVSR